MPLLLCFDWNGKSNSSKLNDNEIISLERLIRCIDIYGIKKTDKNKVANHLQKYKKMCEFFFFIIELHSSSLIFGWTSFLICAPNLIFFCHLFVFFVPTKNSTNKFHISFVGLLVIMFKWSKVPFFTTRVEQIIIVHHDVGTLKRCLMPD